MSLIEQLKTIPDPRDSNGQRHPLWWVLFLSLTGSLCGYWGYRPLAQFARTHHASLCALVGLPLTTRCPSYSTFRRIFIELDAQVWVDVFNVWAILHAPDLAGCLLAADGKSIKCTSVGGHSSAQDFVSLVSVYCHGHEGVVRLVMMHNQQESEIAVARRLMEALPQTPRSACLTLDALHAQTQTLQLLTEQNHDYIIGLKGNQPKLYQSAQQLRTTTAPLSRHHSYEDRQGRQIERTVSVYAAPEHLQTKWSGLARMIWVERKGWRKQQPFYQLSCYISSCLWEAQQFGEAIRGHWGIENGLHWVKDVTFHEDYPLRRGGHAPVSWAIFHSFAITIARRQGFRTIPDCLRHLANQVHQVFALLV
jgi:predicted transposase YbfD/YdcC